ncbi:MAG: clan AA aspartic protease [Planctomycetes bacterium]|nr:clan AA aspartic protease [Planctomycetota bacterium]
MITGTVNADCEAVILLVVVGPTRQQRTVDAVIDTGFSGDLTLPSAVIAALGLKWLGRERGILADGSTDLFDVYSAAVLWDGQPRSIEVEAANTPPLVGMHLLHRHSLHMEVVNGGPVEISSLP